MLLSRSAFMPPEERLRRDPELFLIEEEYSPFIHTNARSMLSLRSLISRAFATVFLLPVRAVLFVVGLFMFAPVYFLASLGVPRSRPLTGLRRRIFMGAMAVNARFVLFALGFLRLPCRRVEPSPARTHQFAPIVCNHSTFADILILLATQRAAGFVAKDGVRRYPYFGRLAERIDSIFVSRDSSSSRGEVARQIHSRVKGETTAPDGSPLAVTIFPEGATTNGRQLIQFRAGVFRAGQPVRPVVIQYRSSDWALGWDTVAALPYLYMLMTNLYNTCRVWELPAYEPSPAEQQHPELYADNVRRYMAHAAGLPLSSATVNDKMALLKYIRGQDCAERLHQRWLTCRQRDPERRLVALRARLDAESPGSSDPLLVPECLAGVGGSVASYPRGRAPLLSRRHVVLREVRVRSAEEAEREIKEAESREEWRPIQRTLSSLLLAADTVDTSCMS